MQRIAFRLEIVAFVGCLAIAAQAATPAQTSLNKCQTTVKKEAAKFVQGYLTAAGTCLQKVSTDFVQNYAALTSGTANACVAQYRKIHDTRALGKSLVEKLQTKITAACTPGTHTLADILGAGAGVTHPLRAADLGEYCARFGGDGSINSLQEWVDCVTAVHTFAARSALATQYPRLLDWLPELADAMSALTPPASDPNKISDAIAAVSNDDAAIDGANNDAVVELQCAPAAGSCGLGGISGAYALSIGGLLGCNGTVQITINGNQISATISGCGSNPTLTGTVDPDTGVYSMTETSSATCGSGPIVSSGSFNANDCNSFSGTYSCPLASGGISGSR